MEGIKSTEKAPNISVTNSREDYLRFFFYTDVREPLGIKWDQLRVPLTPSAECGPDWRNPYILRYHTDVKYLGLKWNWVSPLQRSVPYYCAVFGALVETLQRSGAKPPERIIAGLLFLRGGLLIHYAILVIFIEKEIAVFDAILRYFNCKYHLIVSWITC